MRHSLLHRVATIVFAMVMLGTISLPVQAQKPGSFDGRDALAGYPEVTLLIEVKDARKAAGLVQKAGGQVIYDPNLGVGHDIPFLVINLPGDKVVDEAFIKSLELRSGGSTFHSDCGCSTLPEQDRQPLNFDSLFVPVEDIKLPKLRERVPGQARGKGILVAVIDTGVDASHPVFQDRVVYWSDATREGRISLEKVKVIEGKVTYQEKSLSVPKRIAENKEIFIGIFDETAMGIQVPDFVKTAESQGLDFNRNSSVKDKFLVMIGADIEPAKDAKPADAGAKPEAQPAAKPAEAQQPEKKEEPKSEAKPEAGDQDRPPEPPAETEATPKEPATGEVKPAEKPADANKEAKDKPAEAGKTGETAKPSEAKPTLLAFFDTDGDGQINGKEAETPIQDFNDARKLKREGKPGKYADMVVFPSRTRTIAYPLLFRADDKGNLETATIGAAFISHGTHVAGIIAGNGEQIVGAAPEAEIMSIKTCSGISCTEAAIIRGILEAFFNPLGYVPDVVNISLGSPEQYHKDRMDILIQDLCAKFGTTFFISASNSGTGYRSINHIGSLSPAVLVGAHVSRNSLARHYRLQEGVDVPEHGLLYFSSVGPSYTGQLRPNIVAPGSALSATALIDDGSSMYNGTSMSSPLAAGATAAMLSLARQNAEFAKLDKWRQDKIKAVQAKSNDARYSVTSFPLAIRTALEESAEELPDFTVAQQGHGLLDIDAAYEALLKLTEKVNAGMRLTEFKINDNSELNRLYDRSNNIPPVKRVALSLDSDGELSEATWLKLRNTATEVRLVRVQVQSIDGSVPNLTEPDADGKLPFSIAVPGKENAQGMSIMLGMANEMKGSFSSIRRLEMMQTGKTYIAQYDVFQNDQRLKTLLDVVHKPIELSDLQTEVNLPGIDVEESKRVGCFTVLDQPIKALTFHRYPVAVTERDSALNIQIGFGRDDDGLLMVQAYDPDGYESGVRVIRKSPQLTSEDRTVQMVLSTLEKKGIWEITVSSFSGQWIGPSGYDLLIEAYRFVPSVEKLQLGTKAAPTPAPGAERIMSLMNSSRQVSTMSVMLSGAERIAPMKPFGIAPNFRTYKKIPIPPVDAKQPAAKTTTIVLELDPLAEINNHVSGRIDHQLYKKGPDGKFTVAYKAERLGASRGRKMFRNIPRPIPGAPVEDVYAAMEVFGVFPDGPSLSAVIDHVEMLVVYPEIPPQFQESLRADYLSSDSTADVKLVRITAPTEIIDETTLAKSRGSNATLKVETGDPALPEITVNLPVTLTDKQRPSGGRAVERARATLNISTNHPNISASVPIVISQ
jgi:subtilisin family serine protease